MDEPKAPPELLTADAVEALLEQDDRATLDLYVPEWKKTVRLRQLTGSEAIRISEIPKNEGLPTIVALSCIDPRTGERLFKDIDRLKGKSGGALSRIQEQALILNGFQKGVLAAAKNG